MKPTTDDERRQALERILASRAFAGSAAHRAFLERVVAHALAEPGGSSLKEAALAIDVFGRDPSTFDPRLDPVVRVEARRVRDRLAKYYASEGATDDVVVELPRGAYAPVFRHVTEPAVPDTAETTDDAPARVVVNPPSRVRPIRWWLALPLTAMAVLTGWFAFAQAIALGGAPVTIAVLPLANLTGNVDLDPFVDAFTDEISHGLAHLSHARVAARTSTFSFRRTALDAHAIGQKLNVAFLIEGSVVKSGDGLKAMIQLTRTSDGYQMWSSAVETAAPLGDAEASLAQTVVARAAEQLGLSMGATPSRRAANKDAWDTYVRAVFARESMTPAGFHKAVDLAEQSIRDDPQFARAHVEAALARMYLVGTSDGPAPAADMEIIRSHLDTATRLDMDRSGALALRGGMAALYDLDWTAARAFYVQGINGAVPDTGALAGYAGALALRGLDREAVAYYERALDLDPLNLSIQLNLASVGYLKRDFAGAIRRFREMDDVGPNNPFVLYGLVGAYAASGDSVHAREVLARLQKIVPGWDRLRVLPAVVDATSHDRERALLELGAIDEDFGRRHPYFLGMGFASAGAAGDAVLWLKRAIDTHDMNAAYILVDPLIDPIRSDPRFREVWDAMPAWTAGIAYPGPYSGGAAHALRHP